MRWLFRLVVFVGLGLGLVGSLALPVGAADWITASITLTNIPTNGATITVVGAGRTWTNDVSGSPGTQIQQTNSIPYSATNLINHLTQYPPATGHFLSQSNATNVTVKGKVGEALTVSVSSGWATVTLLTNTVGVGIVVRVPLTIEASSNRQYIASEIIKGLNANATNALDGLRYTNAVGLHGSVNKLVGGYYTNAVSDGGFSTNELAVGARLTNTVGLHGAAYELTGGTYISPVITNGTATNLAWLNGTLGFLTGGYLDGTRPTNVVGLHGEVNKLTGGYYTNSALDRPITTNLVNRGAAISSPGTNGLRSEQFGTGAIANQDDALAVGSSAAATNTYAMALGNGAQAAGVESTSIGRQAASSQLGSIAIGSSSAADGQYSIAIGYGADNAFSNSVAIGPSALTTANNQIKIGTAASHFAFDGRFSGMFSNIAFAVGTTNQNRGDWADSTTTITSLANGTNRIVATNVVMRLAAGPTAAFSIAGIDAPRDGRLIELWNDTGQTFTLNNESGVESVAANRILTASGADVALGTNAIVTLRYFGDRSRWVLRSKNP